MHQAFPSCKETYHDVLLAHFDQKLRPPEPATDSSELLLMPPTRPAILTTPTLIRGYGRHAGTAPEQPFSPADSRRRHRPDLNAGNCKDIIAIQY